MVFVRFVNLKNPLEICILFLTMCIDEMLGVEESLETA